MPTKLEQLQLQFRQKLMQEKEERMIRIHTDSQQKALNKVTRYDSNPIPPSAPPAVLRKPPVVTVVRQPHHGQPHQSPAKKGSPGVDRSRPLPPINREQQRNGQVNRNHQSSNVASVSPIKVPVQNSVRSRSVGSENDHSVGRVNCRVKNKTMDTNHPLESYYMSLGDRKSPEVQPVKNKQPEIQRAKPKGNCESVAKVANGHLTLLKSSIEQRTIAGNNKPSHTTTNATSRGKVKPAATNAVKKPITIVSKRQNASRPVPARKPPNANQDQCRHCGRNFNRDRIDKHISICSKTAQKKVKVFDATKMRVQGTEAENFVKKGITKEPVKPKKTNWKKQHEDFINTIRQAKVAQRHLAAGGKLSDLPPPPPSDTSSYISCPYCSRKFDEGVAQRHIPKCKNIVSNKKPPPRKK